MKKDIEFPIYDDLHIAVVPTEDPQWDVVLINKGNEILRNLMVVATGYGKDVSGENQTTSTFRYFFEILEPKGTLTIEKIDPSVFKLSNEYWISYWINEKMYDRRFVFMPDSIDIKHSVYLQMINKEAVLHA